MNPDRIKGLLERAGIGRWEWDIRSDAIRWDKTLAGIIGWPTEEMPAIRDLKALVEPIDRRRFSGVVKDMLMNGHGKVQLRFQRHDGEIRYISIDGIVEFDASRKPERAYGYVQDVTALHLAEMEVEKKNDDLIIINYINEKLNGGAELKSIYQDILDWFSFQFHSCGLAIGYMDETESVIRIAFQSFRENGSYRTLMKNGFPGEIHVETSRIHQQFVVASRMQGISFHSFWQDVNSDSADSQVSLLDEKAASTSVAEPPQEIWLVPLIIEEKIIGVIYVFGLRKLSKMDQLRIEAISNQIAGIIVRKKSEDRVRSHRKELSKLSQRLFQVQEEERRNLSLELHDELGQSLTAMRINLSAVKRAVESVADERTLTRINETIQMIDEK